MGGVEENAERGHAEKQRLNIVYMCIVENYYLYYKRLPSLSST